MITGIIDDPIFQQHDTGIGHPESPSRLAVTHDFLKQNNWYPSLVPFRAESVDPHWLSLVHTPSYLKRAKKYCFDENEYLDSCDVRISKDSLKIAELAAGSILKMADSIMQENINNGFALIRPPGHHAEKNKALGFCLLNNVAILARYLQQKHCLDKILILDWDVHHGNGTQHLFESDSSILYISIHQYPFYPGSGSASESGEGVGKGATLNCPMPAGSSNHDYEQVFIEKIIPKIDTFRPNFIIISAGFDAHYSDPLGQINLSTDFYGWMTHVLMELANKYCNDRILSVLEGGYNLKYLPLCITEHITQLKNHYS